MTTYAGCPTTILPGKNDHSHVKGQFNGLPPPPFLREIHQFQSREYFFVTFVHLIERRWRSPLHLYPPICIFKYVSEATCYPTFNLRHMIFSEIVYFSIYIGMNPCPAELFQL